MVRAALAGNHRVVDDVAVRLAGDTEAAVRFRTVNNQAAPGEAIARAVAVDADTPTRSAAARHPACPPATLERLSRDDDAHVRRQVVDHPACTPDVLAVLAGDNDPDVAAAAAVCGGNHRGSILG